MSTRRNTLDDEPNTVTLWTWIRIAWHFVKALTLTIYDGLKRKVSHE